MAVPVLTAGSLDARFATLVVGGVLTVWDAEFSRYVVHQAPWDAEAARDVAESLTEHPNYVRLWTWSEVEEGQPGGVGRSRTSNGADRLGPPATARSATAR